MTISDGQRAAIELQASAHLDPKEAASILDRMKGLRPDEVRFALALMQAGTDLMEGP